MKSALRILGGITILMVVVLLFLQPGADKPLTGPQGRAASGGGLAERIVLTGKDMDVVVSEPSVPTISPAVRDLPPRERGFPLLDREMKPRDDHGFMGPDIQGEPWDNPLVELQANAQPTAPDDFDTLLLNFPGMDYDVSPPDTTGDVGPNHFIQAVNDWGGSVVHIYDKAGGSLAEFYLEDLATTAPCNVGYCDPIVQYDELADRWLLTEFDTSVQNLCIYVSTTPDPLGTWYAYSFNPAGGMQDYPKYGVWPDGYYVGVNNGGYVHVLDRVSMLAGGPATSQSFDIGTLPGFGFQLTLPATMEGDAPPDGAPAIFMQPVDTEIHSGHFCSPEPCDIMEAWELHVDWDVPANSTLTQLPDVQIAEFDHTLCGTSGDWDCMPQPGTDQKIDPIREPLHFPLQYRNWGSYETLVGCFAEDVDGLDRAAVHWFELRKEGADWYTYQEGVLSSDPDVHRSVCSAAMDDSGNIAVGYTRTGSEEPYYPSIYYAGRLASDPLGTMPYYEYLIIDGVSSQTSNERWGDYSGIGVDPADGCTFWYTTEYMEPGGSSDTRIAAFKFDACGTPDFILDVDPDSHEVCAPDVVNSTITVGQVQDYAEDVTLVVLNVPSGVTVGIVPPVVTPPGTAELTLDVGGSTADGEYTLLISGTAETTNTHAVELDLVVSSAPPGAPTLVAPPDGVVDMDYAAIPFEWSAVDGATSYRLQVDDDPLFASLEADVAGISGNSYTLPGPLQPATTYFWRVSASNGCGEGPFSEAFSFTVKTLPCTLLVDDDQGDDYEGYYEGALTAMGHDYDLWTVSGAGSPTAGDLAPYGQVIWLTGDDYGSTLTASDQTALATYLDGGGRLFVSGQDIGYDIGGDPFYANYLHADYDSDDTNVYTLTGLDYLAGVDLVIQGGDGADNQSYPSDISPINGAVAVLDYPTPHLYGGVAYQDETYGVVYFSFGFEAIDNQADRTEVMSRTLNWLGGCECEPVSGASFDWTPPLPEVGEEVTFSGFATGSGPIAYAWDFGDGNGGAGAVVNHTYDADGDYTVVMTASNECGLDVTSDVVTVVPPTCEPVEILEILTATEGCTVTFSAELAGDAPFVYDWDFDAYGSSSEPSPVVDFGLSGTYPYTLTVTNCDGAYQDVETGEVTVECEPSCVEVTAVDLTVLNDDDLYAGIPVQFSADIVPDAAAKPYNYMYDPGDGSGEVIDTSSDDPFEFEVTYTAPGTYTVYFEAWNCEMNEGIGDTEVIVVVEPIEPPFYIYLPLVVHGDGS